MNDTRFYDFTSRRTYKKKKKNSSLSPISSLPLSPFLLSRIFHPQISLVENNLYSFFSPRVTYTRVQIPCPRSPDGNYQHVHLKCIRSRKSRGKETVGGCRVRFEYRPYKSLVASGEPTIAKRMAEIFLSFRSSFLICCTRKYRVVHSKFFRNRRRDVKKKKKKRGKGRVKFRVGWRGKAVRGSPARRKKGKKTPPPPPFLFARPPRLCGVCWPLSRHGHKLSTFSYLSDRSCFKQKSP